MRKIPEAMTYAEATAFLTALIDYEKSLDFSYATAFKLDRVVALMEHLGRPQDAFPALHVAGTKGKGSVATYLDNLLRAHGFRTGLYTSPHLVIFRERVRVDGRMVGEEPFAATMGRIVPWARAWDSAHPDDRLSFFDVLTAVGFEAFRHARIDWGVVEVGMGGRLDATNVVRSRVAIIMPIALEHTRFLGETVEKIAGEKAGIIKPGAEVVVGPQPDEAGAVIAARCAEHGIVPTWVESDIANDEADDRWTLRAGGREYRDLTLAALGRHQRTNFAAAVVALQRAGIDLDADTVRAVARETAIPGRLQVVDGRPPILLDVAHTPDSARMLVRTLGEHFPGRRTTLVFSAARDKRVAEIAQIIAPAVERVVLVPMAGARAMPLDELLAAWRPAHPFVATAESVGAAIENARDTAPMHGLIVVAGSFILVGAAMESLGLAPG